MTVVATSLSKLPLVGALMLAIGGFASTAGAADFWPFTPKTDTFDKAALFDLRSLNEATAGASGFVTRSADGNDFVLGDGKPAHFWAFNVAGGCDKPEELAHEARWLAKHGVNLIRLHMQLSPGDNSQVTDVNAQQVDQIMKVVAAMKKEGIYSVISPYWASAGLKPSWGITGHNDAWGVLFCDAILQGGYKAWMKALYAAKNPYTGIPLAQDPAVAVIQLQNEDSLLFWTMVGFINQKGMPYDELRTGFGAYAVKKYGSIDKAYEKWGGTKKDGDEPDKGMLGFNQMWEITSNPGGPAGERVADQVGYFATQMKEFNQSMEAFLHDEIGCRQLVNATNWRTADTVHLNDAERWSYTGNEVCATNKYYSQAHVDAKKEDGWAVQAGDGFVNESAIRDPLDLPTNVKQTVGQPFMITESSWVLPNKYQSEGPLLIAGYSALNGMDAFFWFNSKGPEWDDTWYHFRPLSTKWSCSHPMGVGMFPAAAWMFRHGDVKQGEAAVHEERTEDDMFHERTPLIAEEKAYDPNRDADKIPTKSSVKTGTDPLAFLVGRVEVVLGGKADPAKNKVVDLKKYIDNDQHTVTSITHELVMKTDTGLFTLDTPKAQAAAGFLGKAGAVALKDVAITCANEYATIMVVALDNKPIAESGKLLVQIGTVTRPQGWADHAGEFPIDDKGHTQQGMIVDSIGNGPDIPWTVEEAAGTIAIKNAKITKATIADANAMAAGDATGASAGGVYTLTIPPKALYVILTDK